MLASEKTNLHPETVQVLKRVAVNVVTLLPENEEEALIVLELARRLIEEFLGEGERAPLHNVLPFDR